VVCVNLIWRIVLGEPGNNRRFRKRSGKDIGLSKLSRILAALSLELSLRPLTNQRPTLDELLKEEA
jgi:hypothetical protein